MKNLLYVFVVLEPIFAANTCVVEVFEYKLLQGPRTGDYEAGSGSYQLDANRKPTCVCVSMKQAHGVLPAGIATKTR